MQQIQADIDAVKDEFWSNVEMVLEMVKRNEWIDVYYAVMDLPDNSFGEIEWGDISELTLELKEWMREHGTDVDRNQDTGDSAGPSVRSPTA